MEMRWKWIDHSVNSNDLEGDETNEDLCRIIFFLLGKRRYYKKYFLKGKIFNFNYTRAYVFKHKKCEKYQMYFRSHVFRIKMTFKEKK